MADPRAWIQCQIANIIQETPDVRTFRIVFPKGFDFHFLPGQFIMLHFLDDPKVTRAYSISSSPLDGGYAEITLNKVGKFTSRLFSLKAPAEIMMRGPFGKFTHDLSRMRHAVLVAGGTGITPYRSMARYVNQKRLSNRITIAYSVRIPNEIIFKDEFEKMEIQNPNIKFYTTVTRPHLMPPGISWSGPTGRLNVSTVKNIVSDFFEAFYFLCGSNELIDSFSSALTQAGVSSDHIIFEKWG